jgi:hypothetical protein
MGTTTTLAHHHNPHTLLRAGSKIILRLGLSFSKQPWQKFFERL